MKSLNLLVGLTAWVSFGIAQDNGLTLAIGNLPHCAKSCLQTALADSPCQITNQTCICTNTRLQSAVEGCVLQSCTLRQSLSIKNVTATACHAPIRSRQHEIRVSNIVLTLTAYICVVIRLVYKAVYSVDEFSWDDYTITATVITGLPAVVIIDRGLLPNGLGVDIWTVPFDHITKFVLYMYIIVILYYLLITLIKLTLLFFFLRIFPTPVMRRLLWATIIFNVLWGFAFVLASALECQPVSSYWMSWDNETPRKCVDINGIAWSNAIMSILLDVWMLALPLHQVFQLQLSWRKKIGVCMMFFVGTFVTIVSGLRLQTLVHFATSNNPTWDQASTIRWSNIEIHVGTICACLPALRIILVRMFPKILGSTRGTSERQYSNYGHHSHGTGSGVGAIKSGLGRKQEGGTKDPHAITYTKTFAVQHGESDETSLVPMYDIGEGVTKVRSSNTSEVSL
ncbi:hypothetical protein BKA63DRAFT_521757 [Paraphoma chrysanthemicola]|nr:hypothetical protein BKA63DRAFT_521757 [Paraphoma chrysanthemicola]